MLGRARGFSTIAVLSLALGIGATTVIYAVVDHIAIRPLPYPDPDRLAIVREILPDLSARYPTLPASSALFLGLRDRCHGCEAVAALAPRAFTVTGSGDAERVNGLRITASLLPMLGAVPLVGSGLVAEHEQAGHDRVAMVSEALWRRRFAADPSVVGRTITLNDEAFVVVGVLPATFRAPERDEMGAFLGLASDLDVFIPLALSPEELATPLWNYGVVVRRRPGVTSAQLSAEIATIEASLGDQLKMRPSAVVTPLTAQMVGPVQTALLLLLGAVAALLLMVALNLGSLFAARCALRSRESALRAAIGASRGQLVRLTMVESLLLTAIGGVAGVIVARWGLRALLRIAPATIPRLDEVRLDWRVSLVGLALAAVVGVGFGIIPAIRASRVSPGDLLVSGSRVRGGRAGRGGAMLIGSQVAVSVLLLVTTGLLLGSFVRVLGVDKGFRQDRIVTAEVATPTSYSLEQRTAYYDQAMARLGSVAGVAAVGVISTLPLSGEDDVVLMGGENDPGPAARRPPMNIRSVSPSYFRVLDIPILEGRAFDEADRGKKVTVVSKSAAAALWPGEDAIGRLIGGVGEAVVIGVAADVRTNGLEHEPSPIIYVGHTFVVDKDRPASIVVKATGRTAALASAIRAELVRVDPRVPISKIRALDAVVSAAVAERRFQLTVLALFAITALSTATIGVYGVVAQWVSTRRGEIGVRMALGASPSRVRRLVLREGLGPAVVGAVVGVGGALLVGQALRGLLFGVAPTDLVVLSIATGVAAGAAALACYLPAHRAGRADPVVCLRAE